MKRGGGCSRNGSASAVWCASSEPSSGAAAATARSCPTTTSIRPTPRARPSSASSDLGLLEDLETELSDIQDALERIDNGTYGIDEVTGEPIDPARLEAVPTARTNVDREDRN